MKKLTLDEMKKKEFDILVAFDTVCKKHGLRYGLSYGTLLGAVRHGGFIPWDDDIDVIMPRPDFDKLESLSDTAFGDNLFFSTPKTDKSTIHAYGKLYDLQTEMIEFPKGKRIKTHVYIDVFPLDGLPSDNKKRKKHSEKVKRLILNLYAFKVAKDKLKEKMNIIKRCMWMLISLINAILPKQFLNNRINKTVHRYGYDESEYQGMIVGGDGEKDVMAKDVFVFDNKISFEGAMFPAPNKVEAYLEQTYGDYMTLPPEEERCGHNNEAYIIDESSEEDEARQGVQ